MRDILRAEALNVYTTLVRFGLANGTANAFASLYTTSAAYRRTVDERIERWLGGDVDADDAASVARAVARWRGFADGVNAARAAMRNALAN